MKVVLDCNVVVSAARVAGTCFSKTTITARHGDWRRELRTSSYRSQPQSLLAPRRFPH